MIRAIALVLFLLSACSRSASADLAPPPTSATIQGAGGPVHVQVETADTEAEREHGLMGRTSLEPNDGMVFLFGGDAVSDRFWMKDTEIPLSIAFWDADGTILAIFDMDPCAAEPCPTYGSPVPYIGALEVNQGFFGEHGVHVGDRIRFS